ncbi:aminotransferase class V-fold PLP-dependent enzyme [Nosocomiicoccus massiliensis]|uniref:aminotransferase class V-fold PLP-dependent enzyme n=1 Tax=Nosocomiicoccus massiliensis TaxID=1232430 RepID=UPI00042A8B24|nr:aminotransferase class V-fold PLP-dependent enzyme [Nosocomiicoccus massiliensis]
MIYFDNAATTRPLDDVLQTYDTVNRKYFYNTASLSKGGQEARKLLEASRTQIKQLFKLNDYDLIFTSGATESNNIVIQSVIKKEITIWSNGTRFRT